jgi:hypothetical protein
MTRIFHEVPAAGRTPDHREPAERTSPTPAESTAGWSHSKLAEPHAVSGLLRSGHSYRLEPAMRGTGSSLASCQQIFKGTQHGP